MFRTNDEAVANNTANWTPEVEGPNDRPPVQEPGQPISEPDEEEEEEFEEEEEDDGD